MPQDLPDPAPPVPTTSPQTVQRLFDAFLEVSAGLDLEETLRHIVEAAVALIDAQYGTLGVLDRAGVLVAFVHVGPDPEPSTGDRSPPAEDGETVSFLSVPVTSRGETLGHLYLTAKRDARFSAEDDVALTALAAAAGVAVANARLYEAAEVSRVWLAAVTDVRTALLQGRSPQDVLDVVVDRVSVLTGATAAFLLHGPTGADGTYALRAFTGAAPQDLPGVQLDERAGLVLQAVAEAGHVVLLDMTGPACAGAVDEARWGPCIAVPLRSAVTGGSVVLALRRAGAPPFDAGLAALVSAFADQTGLALDLAARQQVVRRTDVTEDRDRIARDLHDHVIQRVFAAGLSLQSALPRIDDAEAVRRVRSAVEQLDETVRDIRTTIFDLHTSDSARDGDSLRRRLLDIVTETAGVELRPTVRMSGAVDALVTGELAADVEAVVREGVSNAVRHAHASAVTVTLDVTTDVLVEVVDNGRGIDPGAPRSGLRNLEERARRCSGTVSVVCLEDGGTRLRWLAPLPG
ncbi:GAF domain-containing sensor histidine kinase [Modestobacter muralis]|uniref:GAF domain-containing sensor histidine kinase n=1 Tax=Modestobacter muralis TaxID=1608614 RepID=A0A6P0F1M9_9ACTN|nr:GAF domain-containing sensor histidine kinase [Modestobacter muralis]NEN52186.1 GAF domain-containing sensor histidine kinase [Modestobacter muralis]